MIELASLTNALLVERLGMRRLSHTALAAFIVLSAVLAAAALLGALSLWLFIGLMVPLFYLFGLIARISTQWPWSRKARTPAWHRR